MQKPFFAKFLENQLPAEVQNKVVAGSHQNPNEAPPGCDHPEVAENNPNCPPTFVTLKYPCDCPDGEATTTI